MKRRQLLLSAATAVCIPIESARAALRQRVRLWAVRHDNGWTDAFCESEAEAECFAEDTPDNVLLHPIEFIPSGKWLVFRLGVEESHTYTGPFAVPEGYSLPPWCGDTIARPGGDWLTKDQAIAEMVSHNQAALDGDSDRWAVAVELGEEIPVVCHMLEFATGEYAVGSTMTYRPAKIYRHAEAV